MPGTWVLPPTVGFLWTPPWWGWSDGGYLWHSGYWGPHVGFYGGINYGYGYFGSGYEGGYWDHSRFYYNREVNNFGNQRIQYIYSRPPTHRGFENRVAFNGGTGGTNLPLLFGPGGFTNARFLIRRLRRKLPSAQILLNFWAFSEEEANREPLSAGTFGSFSAEQMSHCC